MLELRVGYPSRSEEETIVEQTTGARPDRLDPVLDAESVRAMQELVRRIPTHAESRLLIARNARNRNDCTKEFRGGFSIDLG